MSKSIVRKLRDNDSWQKARDIWQELFNLYRQHGELDRMNDILVDLKLIEKTISYHNGLGEDNFVFYWAYYYGWTCILYEPDCRNLESWLWKLEGFDYKYKISVVDNELTISEFEGVL